MRFNTKTKGKKPNTQLQRGAKSNSNPQGTPKNKAKTMPDFFVGSSFEKENTFV